MLFRSGGVPHYKRVVYREIPSGAARYQLLLSGQAQWIEELTHKQVAELRRDRRVKVVGVEPQTCNTLSAAMAAGERVKVTPSGLANDSLGASMVGTLMFDIAKDHIAEVALVTDDDIREAQRRLWRETQLVTEPGGAAAFAALLSGAYRPDKDERVGVVVCGANTSMDVFGQLFS